MNDSREYKVSFIRRKYVERAFVERFSETSSRASGTGGGVATDALFEAVSANNIPAAITAYASGGNLNTVQKADHASDSGPFAEAQELQDVHEEDPIPTTFPPLPPRNNNDMFGLGSIPNTAESPLFNHSMLQGHGDGQGADDSTALSETSSQFSRSTVGSSYPVSTTDRETDVLQPSVHQDPTTTLNSSANATGATLEIRPRPVARGGRCISSVMVMQTSPLLIALRNSVPFSFDPQYDVYPLAEFLMQNGAASNMSMEVKVLRSGAVEGPFTTSSSTSSVTKDALEYPLPAIRQGMTVATVKGPPMAVQQAAEELAASAGQSIIERDVPLQPSISIGARLSAGTSMMPNIAISNSPLSTTTSLTTSATAGVDAVPITTTNVGSNGISAKNAGETFTTTDAERKAANRRSVGQIVELRGEDGITAMEYLRAKSVARGDIPSPSPSPAPPAPSLEDNLAGPSKLSQARPQSLKERGTLLSSMSTGLINTLTLSPRLRPAGSSNSTSTVNSSDQIHPRNSESLQYPPLSSSSGANYPHNHQDISALFQKRRDSDSGLGSGFFSTMKASSNRDKERAAAKAQARKSGDFSLLSPIVIATPRAAASQSNGVNNAKNRLSLNLDYSSSNSNLEEISPTIVPVALGQQPSRTQKVKASLTKSIRLSAAYFKNSNSKSPSGFFTKDDATRDHPPPVVRRIPLFEGDQSFIAPYSSQQPMVHQTTSTGSLAAAAIALASEGPNGGGRGNGGMSGGEDDDEESEAEDEYTVEELLARQDARSWNSGDGAQLQPQPREKQQSQQQGSHFLLPRSRPSSSFFSSISFSSTPNLAPEHSEDNSKQ